MDSYLQVKPTSVWRARLLVSGPAQYASADQIAEQLVAAGAAQVWAWKSTESDGFPADWPASRLADVSDLLEVQWYVQARVPGSQQIGEPLYLPTEGPYWRLHDAWEYLPASIQPDEPDEPEPPPEPPPEPEEPDEPEPPPADGAPLPVPYPDDVGDYAGRPQRDLDRWAAGVLQEAWVTVMGRYPTPAELVTVQAVGRTEGYYGWASKPPQWAGHHNWGAITCRCPCGFRAVDGYDVNGKWQRYTTCFAIRPTNLEGAIHLVEVLVLRRKAVQKALREHPGDLTRFARAMRNTTYFCRTTGKGPQGQPSCDAATDEQKQADAEHYAASLERNAKKIEQKLGGVFAEVTALSKSPAGESAPPTIHQAPFSVTGALVAVGLGLGGGALILWWPHG